MATVAIRVDREVHRIIQELSQKGGVSMGELISQMVKAEKRRLFFAEYRKAAERQRRNPKAWAEELKDRAAWDATLADGID